MQLYLQDFDRLRSKLSLNRLNLPLSINDPAFNKGEIFALYGKATEIENSITLLEYYLEVFGAKAFGTFKLAAKEFYKSSDAYYQEEVEPQEDFEKFLPRELLNQEGYAELTEDYALILFFLDPEYRDHFAQLLKLLSQEDRGLSRSLGNFTLTEQELHSTSDKGRDLNKLLAEVIELRRHKTPNLVVPYNLRPFESSSLADSTISQVLQPLQLDFFAVAELEGRGKVFICDMDSTAIYEEGLDLVAHELGLGAEVEAITKEAMEGRLDFGESFRRRVALLADKEAALLDTMASNLTINPSLPFVTSYLKQEGYHTILCSGGLVPFASYIAQLGGFADFKANQLETYSQDGKKYFSGKALPPLVDAYFKEKTLIEALLAKEEDLTAPEQEELKGYLQKLDRLTTYAEKEQLAVSLPGNFAGIAAGDGANDIPMLHRAKIGLAYKAKPVVKGHAQLNVERNNLIALVLALEVRKLFK